MWLIIILFVFIVQVAIVLIIEYRNPAKALAWILILFCCPLVGFIVYYFVAKEYNIHKKTRSVKASQVQDIRDHLWQVANIVESVEDMKNSDFIYNKRLFDYISQIPGSPITGSNKSQILTDGQIAYHAMLEAMESAENHINVEFYIFRPDMIGTEFQDVMIRKSQEGIKVRVLCDGIGSYHLKRSFIQRFKETGVEFHFFLPPIIAMVDRRINYRNHRKIVIVDGKKGFAGGLNVGDDYLGLYPKVGFWRDTHLQLEGDAVYFLQTIFLHDWRLASNEHLMDLSFFPEHQCREDQQVQILSSGPDQIRDALQEMCFTAIAIAKERIWITSPYFIPDPGINEGLKTAALSGVDVRIIIPWKPDSLWVHLATLSYVEELLEVGVQFYQYRKGFIHAKIIIADEILASVGTANMDMRSFFSNFELTAVLFDLATIQRIEKDFEEDMQNSTEMQLSTFKSRPLLQKGGEVFCRILSPLL
ncbi:cardiolipin synthase [Paenibacillus crassostreae]|uniref:Cardiolipin synthase n=1 Tax=Paenibacillus crassostreae TaxID=1763538 RepID=A0A167AHH7_9BACL|nr:cardiolipin synthase [Paenibacillus crassostreae]AOZ92311.1 cardiolipin synthase [Paenibacillus crassostreae]OAB71028.1 cardiolipin synthase [Paenibacillus crassostreae]